MSSPHRERSAVPSSTSTVVNDNRSYANLLMELEEHRELLKFLPYARTTWAPNNELMGAAPERLLYGDMMDEKDQLWIYFTLIGGGDGYAVTGSNRMLDFYALKAAQNGGASVRPSKIKELALASRPFKLAENNFQVLVSKYRPGSEQASTDHLGYR